MIFGHNNFYHRVPPPLQTLAIKNATSRALKTGAAKTPPPGALTSLERAPPPQFRSPFFDLYRRELNGASYGNLDSVVQHPEFSVMASNTSNYKLSAATANLKYNGKSYFFQLCSLSIFVSKMCVD